MTETATPKLKIAGLSKSFGANRALVDIDLEVGAGESLVLIGGSGSGKTLLLKCILGLLPPDRGSVLLDGEETAKLNGNDRMRFLDRFGMLFQQSALFDSLPVWQNVAFKLLQDHSVSRAQARDIAIDKLSHVGMGPEVADLFPAELSGGMQKRVGLARAIAADPEIVFLDEPTAGLDPIMSNIINDLVIENVKELGATAVSITSDLVSARRISDHIAMLHEGRLVWTGPTSEVDRSGNDYVDQFINKRTTGPIKMPVRAS